MSDRINRMIVDLHGSAEAGAAQASELLSAAWTAIYDARRVLAQGGPR